MERIKQIRLSKEISQKEVAASLKVAQPTISAWEKGEKKPTTENLKKLAKLYDVSLDYLAGITDNPSNLPKTTTQEEAINYFRENYKDEKENLAVIERWYMEEQQKNVLFEKKPIVESAFIDSTGIPPSSVFKNLISFLDAKYMTLDGYLLLHFFGTASKDIQEQVWSILSRNRNPSSNAFFSLRRYMEEKLERNEISEEQFDEWDNIASDCRTQLIKKEITYIEFFDLLWKAVASTTSVSDATDNEQKVDDTDGEH